MVLYLVTLCHLRTRMLCGKYGWNWTDCSRFFKISPLRILRAKFGWNFFKIRRCIFAILLLSPLGKGCGPLLEQTWVSRNQGCVLPSFVEIGPVAMNLHYFVIVFPWIGRSPSFVQTLVPFTKERFVPSLVEIGPVILVKKKMRKVHRQTDDRRRMIRKAHLAILTSLWERNFLKRNLKQ